MISSFDAIEDRARHAAEGLNLMATTIDIPPLPTEADGRRRRTRVTVAAAAALIVLVVAATLALRGGSTEQNGVPAFEPTPLPGGQRVTTAFRPAASYELPTPHQFVLDEPDDTLVDLGNEFPRADGFVEIVPAGPQPDTAAADARMRVLRRQATLVGGDPATRFVVRVLPKPGDDRWFCADTRRTLCVQRMPRQGRVTLYFVQHDDTTVVILGGSSNDLLGAAVGRVVDGAAATWRWTEP